MKGNVWRRRAFYARQHRRRGRKILYGCVLLMVIVLTVYTFGYVEQHLHTPLMKIAHIRVKQLATKAINEAVRDNVASQQTVEQLLAWQYDAQGNVTGFVLNYAQQRRMVGEVVQRVEQSLQAAMEIKEQLPLGHVMGSALLSQVGPRIPIRFESAGSPLVEVLTRKEDAGINMVAVHVVVRIMAELMIFVPLDTSTEVITTEVPLCYILVKGDVPTYFWSSSARPPYDPARPPIEQEQKI